ncbi:MAG: hypothetical protein V8T26_02085 [[Eubacterium] siraeum]
MIKMFKRNNGRYAFAYLPYFVYKIYDTVYSRRFAMFSKTASLQKAEFGAAHCRKTADTLSHICRNSLIKFMIPLIPAVSLSCG